ncbi:hypothetical protein JXB31_04115 [Candidatus Woesearchaeota archaeon]|nr:hypothetical protein [Candidatus Woesearchaeota archaeon]
MALILKRGSCITDMRKRRSQSTVEFMIVLSLLLVFFLIFLGIFEARRDEFVLKPEQYAAKDVAETLAIAINDVYLGGNNVSRMVYVQDRIESVDDFLLLVIPDVRVVEIRYNERHYSFPLLSSDVTSAEVSSGWVNVSNKEGRIYVQQ